MQDFVEYLEALSFGPKEIIACAKVYRTDRDLAYFVVSLILNRKED